jgi:hypothetical protein
MAAAYGTTTLMFGGGVSRTYSNYYDDTAGNAVRWSLDAKAGAGSPDNVVVPVSCMITDLTIAAASGQSTTTIKVNDQPVSVLLNANFLAAVTNRPKINVMLRAGDKLTMFQVA